MEVQDDDDALIDAQPCEDALQLVAVKDGGEVGGGRRLTEGQGLTVGHPSRGAPGLGVAGVNEDAIGPPLECSRTPQSADVAPNVEVGLLGRVLGLRSITQDAVRHPEEPRVVGDGERIERSPIALLRPDDEVLVHAPTSLGRW